MTSPVLKSYLTSFNGLFSLFKTDELVVKLIEIPIFQRDYAQGRENDAVTRIRNDFLEALHNAVTTEKPIALDFVYGDVEEGKLRPLDGQQRLTTLFLLHWYLAWRADRMDEEQGWKHFEYATRRSARRFCELLATSKPPYDEAPRPWLEDQTWFEHGWEHDPTIRSMLVMIQAIHERFADVDCGAAWSRLVDRETPAISFHLLPIAGMGLNQDLYIKMNSRGKPLTQFENFKAGFEQMLEQSCPERAEVFAHNADDAWANLLWPYRSDNIVDYAFLRYFRFVTDVCRWRGEQTPSADFDSLASDVYGTTNKTSSTNLDFLFECFGTWQSKDIASIFSNIFTITPAQLGSDARASVILFEKPGSRINLLEECCKSENHLSLAHTLLLYSVVLHRLKTTAEFPRRLRVLRNLIEASSRNELRDSNMRKLISDVERLIVDGSLDLSSFNTAQIEDEQLKRRFLSGSPAVERSLFQLEDHPQLRGCLAAFELDVAVFEARAQAFHKLFAEISAEPNLLHTFTRALLAAGDYLRYLDGRFCKFGWAKDKESWKEKLLTGASRTDLNAERVALGRILDAVTDLKSDAGEFNRSMQHH